MPSRKYSKIEKIVNAGFEIGKYSVLSLVLAGNLGCVPYHSIKPISVSPDGRYVALLVPDKKNKDSQEFLVSVFDIDKNEARNIPGSYKQPLYISNTSDKVAFICEGENEKTDVVLSSGDKVERIKSASYPSLSKDGNFLLYSRNFHVEQTQPLDKLELILRDLKTGKEKKVAKRAIFGDFSYDNSLISYVVLNRERNTKGEEKISPSLYVGDIGLSKIKKIWEIKGFDDDKIFLMNPHFIDGNKIIFQTTLGESPQVPKDTEVFTAKINLDSDNIYFDQITPWFNDNDEFFPQYRNGIYYFVSEKKEENENKEVKKTFSLDLMKRGPLGIIGWPYPILNINSEMPWFYVVAKDNRIIYYGKTKDAEGNERESIFMAVPKKGFVSIDKIVDLEEFILKNQE